MQLWNQTATFTRPNNTTAYASGNLVANSTTAGSVVPLQWPISGNSQPGQTRIIRVRVQKSGTSTTNAAFRVHLYETSPTPANGDGAAWSTDQSAHYFGSFDVTSMKAFTDGACEAGAPSVNTDFLLRLSNGKTIYGLVEARAAYTPVANEIFQVTLEMMDEY